MTKHMNGFQYKVNRLTNLEIVLSDELQACLLLGILPDCHDKLAVKLSNFAPDRKFSITVVKESLFKQETSQKSYGISNQSKMLVAEQWGNNKSKKPLFKHGKSNDRLKLRSRKGITYFHCGK